MRGGIDEGDRLGRDRPEGSLQNGETKWTNLALGQTPPSGNDELARQAAGQANEDSAQLFGGGEVLAHVF